MKSQFAIHGRKATKDAIAAAKRYWEAWPQQHEAFVARYNAAVARWCEDYGCANEDDLREFVRSQLSELAKDRKIDEFIGGNGTYGSPELVAFFWQTDLKLDVALYNAIFTLPWPFAAVDEAPSILGMTASEIRKTMPPVAVLLGAQTTPDKITATPETSWIYVSGLAEFPGSELPAGSAALRLLVELCDAVNKLKHPILHGSPLQTNDVQVRKIARKFMIAVWDWHGSASTTHRLQRERFRDYPTELPQPTFPEVKRIARGLAQAPDGTGWFPVIGEFAVVHKIDKAEHDLRLDGTDIAWWGRENDNNSLLEEVKETGQDGIATLHNAIGLVLHSENGHVDIEIDELISRIGMDPRSRGERQEARLKVWRILTILSAVKVVGARKASIYDRVSGKHVRVESQDSLIDVTPWRPVGSQEAFDNAVAPLAVTISGTPWLVKFRGDRRILQDYGNLLAISRIPIGKVAGAWARSVGWALQQLWREQATRSEVGRVGDDKRPTVRFRPFTRRELLDLFQPKPTVTDVLGANIPSRAIDYWEGAIKILSGEDHALIGHYGGYDGKSLVDWHRNRPRKGWADSWLDEPLDIRPRGDGVRAIKAIASAAKNKKRRGSKVVES